MMILVGDRKEAAQAVQQALTDHGCLIKTRLGMHGEPKNPCSEKGLIILELIGDPANQQDLFNKVEEIPCVHAKMETLSVNC